MNNEEYQRESLKVDRGDYLDPAQRISECSNTRLMHSLIGICTETGELQDAMKKHLFYGTELYIENLKEECGDLLWYMSILLDEIGSSFSEVMEMNNIKLKKRYEKGFSEEAAIKRADKI